MAAKALVPTAASIAWSLLLALVGSCRYVGIAYKRSLTHTAAGPLRCKLGAMFVSAMTFVDPRLAIAARRAAVARVLLRRNAGKLSRRRAVYK